MRALGTLTTRDGVGTRVSSSVRKRREYYILLSPFPPSPLPLFKSNILRQVYLFYNVFLDFCTFLTLPNLVSGLSEVTLRVDKVESSLPYCCCHAKCGN